MLFRSNAVEDVVERRGNVVDILGIDRRNKRLVQPREDLMDELVSAMLQHVDFGSGQQQPRISDTYPVEKLLGSFRNDLYLFEKQVIKLLFAWQESHEYRVTGRNPILIAVQGAGQSGLQDLPAVQKSRLRTRFHGTRWPFGA